MSKEKSVVVAKSSQEHEHYFRAFVDGTGVRLKDQDMFGNSYETEVDSFSAQHLGDNTKFVYRIISSKHP